MIKSNASMFKRYVGWMGTFCVGTLFFRPVQKEKKAYRKHFVWTQRLEMKPDDVKQNV